MVFISKILYESIMYLCKIFKIFFIFSIISPNIIIVLFESLSLLISHTPTYTHTIYIYIYIYKNRLPTTYEYLTKFAHSIFSF